MNALLEKLIGTRAGQAAVDRIVAESAAEIEKDNEQMRIEHILAVNKLRDDLAKALQPIVARREKAEAEVRKAQEALRVAHEKHAAVVNEQRGIEHRFTRAIDGHKRTLMELRIPDVDTSLEILDAQIHRIRVGQNLDDPHSQKRVAVLHDLRREVQQLAEELPVDTLERAKEIREGLESEAAV